MRKTSVIVLLTAVVSSFCALHAAGNADLQMAHSRVRGFQEGDDYGPVYVVRDAVYAATAGEEKKTAMSRRLLYLLMGRRSTYMCRKFICHDWLPLVAGEEAVPVLLEMLDGERQSALAIEALEQIPVPGTLAALRKAVGRTSGAAKLTAVRALGARRDAGAVHLLADLLDGENRELREEAMHALAAIGTGEAARTLLRSVQPTSPGAADALQTLAQRRLEEGDTQSGERVARLLLQEDRPVHVRRAGLSAIARLDARDALPHLMSAVKGEERAVAGHALKLALERHRNGAAALIGRTLPGLPDGRKVLVLRCVGLHGDRSFAGAVADMMKGQSDPVRAAAARALGRVGTASHVDALLDLAAGETGDVRQAAREALAVIDAGRAGRALLSRLQDAGAGVRAEALRAAVARRVEGVKARVLELADGPDEAVRLEAYRGFEELCGAGDAQTALDLLLHSRTDAERSAAVRALNNALSATGDRAAAMERIVRELDEADLETLQALLSVAPDFPTEAALEKVKELLRSEDAGVREAALRSLAEWSGPGAAEALMEVVKEGESRRHRTLALRGLIGMLPRSSDPAGLFRRVRPHVERVEEKRLLLSAASKAEPSTELLRELVPMAGDEAVAREAAVAVAALAQKASYVDPALLRQAVDEIESAGLREKLAGQVKQIRDRADELEQSVRQSMNQIETVGPNGFRRVLYVNCGGQRRASGSGVTVGRLTGRPYFYGGQPTTLRTVAFDGDSLRYEITGLSADADYMLGFAWWDVDRNGRVQSVSFGTGEEGGWTQVLPPSPPVAYHGGEPTWARVVLPVPSEFAEEGRMQVAFDRHEGPNVTVSELWLLERSAAPAQGRVAIVTGDDIAGHPWRSVSAEVAEILREDRRLEVCVQETPHVYASPLLDYWDGTVLCFQNQHMETDPEMWNGLRGHVRGGAGLVLVHFACGAFQAWDGFVEVAGRVWNPEMRAHDPHGEFTVRIADPDHAVTRGMSDFRTTDELYTCLGGDASIHVLATATSKVDEEKYPMAFTRSFGRGRAFHCALGHDVRAFRAEGVRRLYRRGVAWALGLEPVN